MIREVIMEKREQESCAASSTHPTNAVGFMRWAAPAPPGPTADCVGDSARFFKQGR